MQLLPLGDRLLVQRAEEKTMAGGGLLHLAENARERPQEGLVLAIGPDATGQLVQPGDTVLFGKFAGVDLTVDGAEILLLRIDEALAVKRASIAAPETL